MSIRCFMLTPTDRVARWLRRVTSAADIGWRLCEPEGQHVAEVRIEDGPLILEGKGRISTEPLAWPADDPRWPARCRHCEHSFPGLKGGHLLFHRLWRTPGGELVDADQDPPPGVSGPPVGAMWFSDPAAERGLCVMTPGGLWTLDRPPWTRGGRPPLVSAVPGVVFEGVWHGRLRDGLLETLG